MQRGILLLPAAPCAAARHCVHLATCLLGGPFIMQARQALAHASRGVFFTLATVSPACLMAPPCVDGTAAHYPLCCRRGRRWLALQGVACSAALGCRWDPLGWFTTSYNNLNVASWSCAGWLSLRVVVPHSAKRKQCWAAGLLLLLPILRLLLLSSNCVHCIRGGGLPAAKCDQAAYPQTAAAYPLKCVPPSLPHIHRRWPRCC